MFNKVVHTDAIGSTPAAINRKTGVLYLNPKVFYQYPKEWQRYILLHELGHYVLKTKDELKADDFAFRHFVRQGGSLEESAKALYKVLDVNNNPEHYERALAQLQRAKEWDAKINGNPNRKITKQEAMCNTCKHKEHHVAALMEAIQHGEIEEAKGHVQEILLHASEDEKELLESKYNSILEAATHNNYMGQDRAHYLNVQDDNISGFFCFGNKRCQERKKILAEARADRIRSKGKAAENRSKTGLELAKKGLKRTGAVDFIKGVGSAGNQLLRGGAGSPDPTPTSYREDAPENPEEEPKKKSKTGLYIGIGVAVLVVIAVIAYFLLRKKAEGGE